MFNNDDPTSGRYPGCTRLPVSVHAFEYAKAKPDDSFVLLAERGISAA